MDPGRRKGGDFSSLRVHTGLRVRSASYNMSIEALPRVNTADRRQANLHLPTAVAVNVEPCIHIPMAFNGDIYYISLVHSFVCYLHNILLFVSNTYGFPNLGSADPRGSPNKLEGVCKNIINIQKTTALEQVIACSLLHAASPGSIPGRDSFLGEVFPGFFLTCKTNVRKL